MSHTVVLFYHFMLILKYLLHGIRAGEYRQVLVDRIWKKFQHEHVHMSPLSYRETLSYLHTRA